MGTVAIGSLLAMLLRLRSVRLRPRWGPRFVVPALVLVLAVAGGAVWWLTRDDSPAPQRITTTVVRGTQKTTVSATGTITPRYDATLAFSSSGTVSDVEVSVGEKVQKGDVLARIDTTALQAQRDAAAAQVTAATSQVSEDADASSAQLAASVASLSSAKSQLAEAEQALADATLRAPFTGTVSSVGYDVGDPVGSSGGSGSTSPVASTGSGSGSTTGITVISPTKLLVDATVSAADISSIKKGLQAEITATGSDDVVYGTVQDVGVIASASDSGAAQFPVTIAVTGTAKGLYAGSSATVSIIVRQATDVLTVSTPALHTTDGRTWVWLVQDGKRVKRTVKTGSVYGMQTEITSGLEEGDTVEIASFRSTGGGGRRGQQGGGFQPPGGGGFPGGGQGFQGFQGGGQG